MNFFDALTIQAFSLARLQLAPVLTEDLEDEIHSVGDRVAHRDPHAAEEVRKLVKQHSCLQDYYESAYNELQRHYQSQERTKDLPSNSAEVLPNNWEHVVAEILQADAPLHTVRHLIREVQTQPSRVAAGMIDAFFTVLQKVLMDLDSHAIAVLKSLSERPLSLNDLIRLLDGSDPHVQGVVHMLWNEGYVSRLNSSIMDRILPLFGHQNHEALDPDALLTLSAKGHFMLHPVVTLGQQGAAAG